MKNSLKKKLISLLLCVLLAVSGIVPAFSAYADDGVINTVELQIFYADSNTMVPTYMDDNETEFRITMVEGKTLQLKHELIDSVAPDNAHYNWYSDNPVLVDVDQNGLVKAFDSSKGAVVQLWIDNEVKPIPLIGSRVGELLEKAFNNEYVDLDTLDTEAIKLIAKSALGSESWMADYLDAYEGDLIDSLGEYLDRMNTAIYCQLIASDGTLLGEDAVHITVERNNEWYANFLPNGTHITNKSKIATTQAVGNTVQLQAITSPQRLHYGVQYSVKSSSIFSQGKVVATVTDGGLVSFKKTGKVTILASPDSEDVINGLLKFINYFYALENTGTLNTDDVAQIMIEYMGLDINRAVLAGMLDVAFGIAEIAQDTADPVQLTATAVEIVANIILQMRYNDSITFEVVEAQPIESFDIEGANSVREGSQIQLQLANVQPSTGDMSDVVWSSSNPEVASIDEKTGIITGLDAGGPYGQLSTKDVTITATSTTNNVSRQVTVKVVGKTGNFISHVDINASDIVEIGASEQLSYTVYPVRAAESQNLYVDWGIQTDEVDEEGNPVYLWATEEEPAKNDISQITSKGQYTSLDGGTTTIAIRAYTGYELSNGNFYEISSCIGTRDVKTGIPVENISINVTGVANSNSKIDSNKTVTINGVDYQYVTIDRWGAYYGNGAVVKASVTPSNATNQNLTWVIDNSYYSNDLSDETHTATVKQKAGHEVADIFNVYAVSNDGRVKSNVITVSLSDSNVTSNTINGDTIDVVNKTDKNVSHTVTYDGGSGSNAATPKANWYSSDESIFTVRNAGNDNSDAIITGVDVGEATLYCVTANSAIVDTAKIVVKPNKTYLKNIIDLCEKTAIIRTDENKKAYQQYMRKLDLAYSVYYDQNMASQTTCDTYAQNLLSAFYKLGGFVSIGSVDILGTNKKALSSNFVTVSVGSTTNYTKYSYDFDYKVNPASAMYSDIEWTSSSSSIRVDENGICTPTSNDPCSAIITCKITDYMGHECTDSVYIAFARNKVTGVSLNYTELRDQKVGETTTLTATVSPTGISSASVKDVFWKSSDESVATVSDSGVVTYVYGGDCVITCTTADGGYTAKCNINVVTNYDPLRNLLQSYTDLNLEERSYYPETWTVFAAARSEAQQIVDEGGHTQKEVDAAYAKLEAAFNQLERYNYMTRVEIYIEGEPTSEFYQYDLNLITESISGDGIGYTNGDRPLKVRLYPNNASYETVTWESETSDISVSSEGVATPTSNKACYGQVKCTVTDHFGNQCTDSVWVSFAYFPVTALRLSDTNINGTVGATYQLACTVEPTGTGYLHIGKASIQDFYWESDDINVATVDENGLVTFVDAGSTKIRAVSYDGGVSAECIVSTEGDRSALKAAVENYKDVVYQNYDYTYGQDFKRKYDIAVNSLNDLTLSQAEIDAIAQDVVDAYQEMIEHPYIVVEDFTFSYTTYQKGALSTNASTVESETISDNNHLTINLSKSGYQSNNSRNYIDLKASVYPSNASYKSISWSVVNSNNLKSSTPSGNNTIRLQPDENAKGYAKLKITTKDNYDRETSEYVYVVLADNVATGLTVKPSTLTLFATAPTTGLQYQFAGGPDVTAIEWSSSDEGVVRVTSSGALTPVDTGTAVVTAVSYDGGYTSSANIIIETDFSELAEKVNEYKPIIENTTDEKLYTEESLNTLAAAVQECEQVINQEIAKQSEVNSYLETLSAAYEALVPYLPATGVTIRVEEGQSGVSEPNEGFIRNTSSNSLLTNKKIQLVADLQPDDAQPLYQSIEWTSTNNRITVDELGTVTNLSPTGSWAIITCTVTTEEGDSFSDSKYVSFVRYGATAVTFDESMIYGAPEQTKALKVNLNQGDLSTAAQALSVNDCLYESSNEEIATVDADGNVTFHTQGEAIITVTAIDGGYVGSTVAYTTWDTTALQAAIADANAIDYKEYAYEQGTALQEEIEAANAVMADVYASQAVIDEACDNLLAAIANLEGHEFVHPEPVITIGESEIANGVSYPIDENNQVVASYEMNEGAMIQSASWLTKDEDNAVSAVSGNDLVITKTGDGKGTITVELITVDDYNRADIFTYTINIVDAVVNIESISLTADGETVTGDIVKSGYPIAYTTFNPIQLAYVANPSDATEPVSVVWSSSSTRYITVDENGLVDLTTLGKATRNNSATITCTVTNSNGSTVSASVNITIKR